MADDSKESQHDEQRSKRLQSVDIDLSDFNANKRKQSSNENFNQQFEATEKKYLQRFRTNSRSSKILEIMSNSTNFESSIVANNCISKSKCNDNKANKLFNLSDKTSLQSDDDDNCFQCCKLKFGIHLIGDIKRRLSFYISDYSDGIRGPQTLSKVLSTTIFLYCSILLPTIAFSSLNLNQTEGQMGDLKKAIIGQAVGGLFFAIFCGQPLVIIMTTAPLCLFTKVIFEMSSSGKYNFSAMYGAVGIINAIFLTIYSLFGISEHLIKWCTRFVQEVFAMFIVCALITDAFKDTAKNFRENYYSEDCLNATDVNSTTISSLKKISDLSSNLTSIENAVACSKETSLLYLLLLIATVGVGLILYKFNNSHLFTSTLRNIISSYALPIAIVAVSVVSYFVFGDIDVYDNGDVSGESADFFEIANFESMPLSAVLMSIALGFALSLLFLMDQNISAAMVDSPQNKLDKGTAYHMDILFVGLLNAGLTVCGFPMMHGVLPHSPMHAKCLADIDETVVDGHKIETVTRVRETRLTGIFSHLLILASVLMLPKPICYIPTPVLNGLFIYVALTSLDDLQMFDRILLLFTEQSKYPPFDYVRQCPQTRIHCFTILQVLLLIIMCALGFSPINAIQMLFPVFVLLMIPIRQSIVSKFIGEQHLEFLDN